jgi:hypothetical protein
MTTSVSTLTQNTFEEAHGKIRKETERSIEQLKKDMQGKIQAMENSIAEAVIQAIRSSTPLVVNMEIDSDAQSHSTQGTAATIKTLTEQFETLTNVVSLLSERVSELAEKQDISQNKRNRTPDLPPRQLATALNANQRLNKPTQSPPTKLSRPSVPTPPPTPPPKEPRFGRVPGGQVLSHGEIHLLVSHDKNTYYESSPNSSTSPISNKHTTRKQIKDKQIKTTISTDDSLTYSSLESSEEDSIKSLSSHSEIL